MLDKNKNRITIYNVAQEAGVSITTVSRFLNNPENVKISTGERVAAAMEKLDYIPQGNAGSRAHHRVGRVGVLTPFFPAPSFVARLRGMIKPLKEANYEVVIYTIETAAQLDEYLKSIPFTRRIDGLIIISINLTHVQRRILQAADLDVVMIESDEEDFSRVIADDYNGGKIAAELFIKKNYHPVAFLGDMNKELSYSCKPSDIRLRGFQKALIENGITIDENLILESDTTVDDAKKAFLNFLDSNKPPRAIFAMSDIQAIGVLKAANTKGVKVPEEMAVLGFDNIETAEWMELSTISQHLTDSGRIAAKLLLERLSGNVKTIQKVNLQVGLIERSTT
ncbi:MAG: LacI family DNA-binding transcriptional regulator [Spirochaetales bacterium]|nr:LacI family DNA-binding transcriptional regulator [Spirochaetales bacterium]